MSGRSLLVMLAILVLPGCATDADSGDRQDPARSPGSRHSPAGPGVAAQVTRVVDGDTIEVVVDGREQDVRYIGVDTPESVKPDAPVECFGPQASEFNRSLVEGERVRLVLGAERRDRYGRLLAYVYLGKRLVNAALIRRGYARSLTIAPNDARALLFERLEQHAGRRGRGLWGAC